MKKTILTSVLAIGVLVWGHAQSSFNARLNIRKIDCNTRKAQIDLEISSLSPAEAFYMGDANLRFGYDASVLRLPMLIEQPNFSSEAKEGGEEYGPQNLNGSSEGNTRGVVSLNLFYTGTGKKPQQVSATWLPVATVEFDIVNLTSTSKSPIAWYTTQDFPRSGMSEVLAQGNGFKLKQINIGQFNGVLLPEMNDVCGNATTTPVVTAPITPPITVVQTPVENTPSSPNTPPSGSTPSGGINPTTNSPAPIIIEKQPTNTQDKEPDFFIPDGFSPNGDNINDVFQIKNKGGVKVNMAVYNRFGILVYSNPDYRNDWSGTNNEGQALGSGTYFYIVKLSDGKRFSKALSISR